MCSAPAFLLDYRPDISLSAPADSLLSSFFSHRSTSINLKKRLSSSYPEPCQMKNTSKNQVNTKNYLKGYSFFGKADVGGFHRGT